MKIIDSDYYKASGIETMFFSGGEPHVKIPTFNVPLLLWLKLRTWADVGFAALLMNALDWQGCAYRAFIPYFPGARQDRSDGHAPFTLEIMAYFLRQTSTYVFDPHSERTVDLVNPICFMPTDLLQMPRSENVFGIIAPDEGATARAAQFRDKYYPEAELVQGTKVRDPHSGELSNYNLEPLTRIGTYIIVDDICDGGGTFNLLVEAFQKDPLSKFSGSRLEMFVSHGIFSKGINNISSRIEKITTTDSWCRESQLYGHPRPDRVTVIPLIPNLIKRMEF